MLKEKRIAKDIKIYFVLALINGPIKAIAVAPHIDMPDASKILSFISNLNILVSVIHKECAIADALATGLIAMSKNDIIRYSNQNNIASMLVIKDGNNMKKYYSSSFKKFLKD